MKLDADLLTRAECEALLLACGRSRTGRRNQALITLGWRGGLRIGEILALREQDVDWETSTIRILHGKGDKARTTAVGAQGLAVLEAWREVRRGLGLGRGPFISTLAGRGLPGSYPRGMLRRVAARAGIEKRVHPHALRHAFACHAHDEGAPLGHISILLGHFSIATTAVYLRRLGADAAVEWAAGR